MYFRHMLCLQTTQCWRGLRRMTFASLLVGCDLFHLASQDISRMSASNSTDQCDTHQEMCWDSVLHVSHPL